MDLKKQFEDIILTKTRDGFHDAGLIELLIKFELKEISIKIEHWKDGDNEREEKIFFGNFLFKNISNLYLNNKVNCFGINEEIDSFDIKTNQRDYIFILTGIKGWVFSFSATSFEYKEILYLFSYFVTI